MRNRKKLQLLQKCEFMNCSKERSHSTYIKHFPKTFSIKVLISGVDGDNDDYRCV